jgi:hypothetical protein
MSDFPINIEDLTSSKSITDKIASSFYPNGEMVIKGTSLSQQPYQDRTLRSADPIKLLQGDGIYRNPAYAVNAYAQSTQSALHGIIASQADIDDNVKILDPNDPNEKNVLTGAAARMEIAKNSMLYTGYAPTGFDVALKALNDSVINPVTNPDSESAGFINTSTRSGIGP